MNGDKTMSLAEIAKHCGTCHATVIGWARRGLKSHWVKNEKMKPHREVFVDDLREFLKNHKYEYFQKIKV